MDLDVVLDRSVGADVAAEIALLRTAHRFRARGVSQSRDGIRQFVVEVDSRHIPPGVQRLVARLEEVPTAVFTASWIC